MNIDTLMNGYSQQRQRIPNSPGNFYTVALHTLKCFWGTVAIAIAIIAMLRVNSLLHTWSPTPRTPTAYYHK